MTHRTSKAVPDPAVAHLHPRDNTEPPDLNMDSTVHLPSIPNNPSKVATEEDTASNPRAAMANLHNNSKAATAVHHPDHLKEADIHPRAVMEDHHHHQGIKGAMATKRKE